MTFEVRPCREDERPAMLAIINAAAERYRGVIPADRWREPYMPAAELAHEIGAGVEVWGVTLEGELVGVMGVQPVADVVLIRHAYVAPDHQGSGAGGRLLDALRARTPGRMLVGTWAAAEWAVRFYARRGFSLVAPEQRAPLLRRYWSVPDRQIDTSVVLSSPPVTGSQMTPMAADAG